ncbi:MAG: Bax inhibitor-1/YccA family protein, partial [Desulfovibrionaceae bacterium]|nr:Bax inhibitor-1/YccA family protein [Desulfovibrionaceae bacterium]
MNNSFSTRTAIPSAMSVYMSKVYLWMTIGLALTAFTAWAVANTGLISLILNPIVPIVLAVAEIGLVIAISAAIHRMSAQTATLLFMLFSLLNGVTLSAIFVVYTLGSIANAFVATAGTFLAMSIYGSVTKRDLTSLGSFLFMGLIGLIIASIVNIFLASPAMDFVISAIGVLIFTLYTAYDTQKLRAFGEGAPLGDTQALQRGAILGALTLYLDFINLFLYLLRFLGSSR